MSRFLNGSLFGVAIGCVLVGELTAFLVTLSIALAATYLATVIRERAA